MCLQFARLLSLIAGIEVLYGNAYVPEVTLCIAYSTPSYANTPFQEFPKILLGVVCVFPPVLLDERLQLGEEFFDWIEVG